MTLDKIIVGFGSFIGILFTYWFFLQKKDEIVAVSDSVNIIVEGGYKPDVISILEGKPITINFFRKDPNTCLEEVMIPEFKIRKYLPLNKKIAIEITPKNKGEYPFQCGMNMFHGKIIVK